MRVVSFLLKRPPLFVSFDEGFFKGKISDFNKLLFFSVHKGYDPQKKRGSLLFFFGILSFLCPLSSWYFPVRAASFLLKDKSWFLCASLFF